MEELPGKTLGQYHIQEKLGQGGMAVVYKAYQPSLDRYVAVKVLPPTFAAKDPNFILRFEREARSIARLKHPNILTIYDFGIDRDYSYLVMQYVEGGQTLGHTMRKELNREQAIDYIIQVAHALDYAHKREIVHRDVKPSNILLDEGRPLLSDFGLAKVSRESATRLTGSGIGMGTPAYMSPEQGLGETVDHRTDIYGLGAVLYEILTGSIPHDADTPWAILVKRRTIPPPDPRQANPAIPAGLAHVTLRALAINPEDRFESAANFALALRRALTGAEPFAPVDESTVYSLPQPPTQPEEGSTMAMPTAQNEPQTTFLPEQTPASPKRWLSWYSPWVAIGGVVVMGILLWLVLNPSSPSSAIPTASSVAAVAPTATKTAFPAASRTPVQASASTPTPLAAPLVKKFLAMPESIVEGESVTIEWDVAGVEAVSVAPLGAGFPPIYSQVVSPQRNTTYILNASFQGQAISPVELTIFVTPAPTPTSPTPTRTPTLPTATPTEAPATPTPSATSAPAINLPTATPVATPTSSLPQGTFTALDILNPDDFSTGPAEFQWDWIGPVPPDTGFEVRVWRDGESPAGAHDAVLDNKQGQVQKVGDNRYRLNIDISQAAGVRGRSGDYLWTVLLVQINPQYAELGLQAEPARLRFALPGSGGGSDGNGGSPGGGGGID